MAVLYIFRIFVAAKANEAGKTTRKPVKPNRLHAGEAENTGCPER